MHQIGKLKKIRPEIFIFVTIIITSLFIYTQVKNHDFINFDDNIYVYENEHVKSGLTPDSIKWAFGFSSEATYWHPLTWFSHMLDCEIFGLDAGKHHLSSVFLHIINSMLLFMVLRLMTRATWRSGIVAVLFAVHPVNVDSVAWVAERKNLLSTFFWLLTMLSYFYYSRTPNLKRYLIVAFIFLLGLLSKPMLVTLPFVLLLLDFWPLKRFELSYQKPDSYHDTTTVFARATWKFLIFEKIPLIALSFVMIWVSMFSLARLGSDFSTESVPMLLRISNALVSYFTYMGKLIWPQNLSIYYPFPETIPAWQAAVSFTTLIMITLFVLYRAKKEPYLSVGWFWFTGTLVPVSGLIQAGAWPAIAERWTYVPQIGFFMVIVWGITDLIKNLRYKKQVIIIISSFILFTLSFVSKQQTYYWRDHITLYTHIANTSPDNFFAQYKLGIALQEKKKFNEAIYYYSEAIRIKPMHPYAHNHIGVIYKNLGDYDAAIKHYSIALSVKPDNIEALTNMGCVLEKKGEFDEAVAYHLKALKEDPSYAAAHTNLGIAFAAKDNNAKAVYHFTEALKIDPLCFNAHNNMGNILLKQKRLDQAIFHYRKSIQIDSGSGEAKKNLKIALSLQERFYLELDKIRKAQKLRPEDPVLFFQLGELYFMMGSDAKALSNYEKALKFNPEMFQALNKKAIVSFQMGKYEDTLKAYQKIAVLQPENNLVYYNIACVYASDNNADKSVKWLRRAVEKGYSDLSYLKKDKDLENIRSSSAYQEFINDVL